MDALVLLAIEADKPKKKAAQLPAFHCDAKAANSDILSAIGEITYCVEKVAKDVRKVTQSIQKPTDYRMDVIRDEEGTIYQIDVKRVTSCQKA